MKKTITLSVLFLMAALTVSAQGYRKWDFTNWSAQTIANLAAEAVAGVTGGNWSDTEKADGANPQVGNCYWSYADNLIDGELAANGSVIAETEGLLFNTAYTSRRSLAIAVNYPSTSLGDYAGSQYLWLGGGNAKSAGARLYCFTIPKVRIGQKITMTVESHKPAESRGVSLFVGSVTDDACQIGESFTPKTQETYTWEDWTLPEGASDEDGDGLVDVMVYNTNGCHIYSIEVGDNTQKSVIGYLYNGELGAELAYEKLDGSDRYALEGVEAKGALTLEQLSKYNAIVISSTVTDAEAISSLKDIFPFVPTLNLNPALYEAWGYGKTGATHTFAQLQVPGHALFRNLEVIEAEGIVALPLTTAVPYQGVTLAGPFANDLVLATVMETEDVAIHAHNLNHNGFLYIPYTQDALADAVTPLILENALNVVINSKASVTAAPKPTFSLEYKNQNTNVTISSSIPNAQIYYTIDGSEPTTGSTLYTEPFNLTAATTVKAIAIGEGYLQSEVAEQYVDLKVQAEQPVITMEQENGQTIVTISSSAAEIYYNYSGLAEKAKSSLYTDPITLTQVGRTIYAFAVGDGYVDSELASQEIIISNPKVRVDVLAHMDANTDEYSVKGDQAKSTTSYFFSWGKNKGTYPYYNLEAYTEETDIDPDTGDEIMKKTYTELSPEEEIDFENGWMIRSRGQLTIWEGLSATDNVGDSSGRNPATVDDMNSFFPVTKNFINLADKNTTPSDATFPYNAYIVTTGKYQGPFDIVANIGNGAAGEENQGGTLTIVLQTSADGNAWESEWQTVGDTIVIDKGYRLYHNITRSYEGTDEVYVRAYLCANNSKAQFYDIYLANQGTLSEELLANGISELAVGNATRRAAIYNLSGARQQQLHRGLNIIVGSDGTVRKQIVK